MNAVILACSSLRDYVNEAQKKRNTEYPVIWLSEAYHVDPKKMHQHIIDKVKELPKEVDTILVAMGYCGGSWEGQRLDRRVVMPRVDECVSLLLHVDDGYHRDLKETGHLYMKGKNPREFSLERAFTSFTKDRSSEEKADIRKAWTDYYTHVDIVDTGMYDCRSSEYLEEAQKNADWIGGVVQFRQGSNLLIEKLVSGQWDEQFFVAEAGEWIDSSRF